VVLEKQENKCDLILMPLTEQWDKMTIYMNEQWDKSAIHPTEQPTCFFLIKAYDRQ